MSYEVPITYEPPSDDETKQTILPYSKIKIEMDIDTVPLEPEDSKYTLWDIKPEPYCSTSNISSDSKKDDSHNTVCEDSTKTIDLKLPETFLKISSNQMLEGLENNMKEKNMQSVEQTKKSGRRQYFKCSKRSSQKIGSEEHISCIPINVVKFSFCMDCGKRFVQRNPNLKHCPVCDMNNKTYICADCDKTFVRKSNLRAHITIHSGRKPFRCLECGKSYRQRCHLQEHVLTHRGVKPFKCTDCGNSFLRKSNYLRHTRTHVGENVLKCKECGLSFRKKNKLREHLRSHRREKPYPCHLCSKSFQRKSNLNRHNKQCHLGIKFECSECGKILNDKCKLKIHIQHHTE